MKLATLCTGIEGFGVGFERAGLKCVFQCEQDKHCLRILERHYPNVPRTTDVNDDRTAAELVRLRPHIIAFGSPCQDLSVAGRRAGISAERSGLFFRCVELCFTCEAPIVVWENVPGVFSSNHGNDFAAVLEAFTGFRPSVPLRGWRDTGVCIGPLYSVAWAVLDAQWFGVPQRRRRVFIVGCFGDRGRPYEILSLAESLPWDSPPSRKTQSSVAGTIDAGAGVRRGAGINPGTITPDVAAPLTRGADSSGKGGAAGRRQEDDFNIVASSLKASGKFDHAGDESRLVCGTLNSGGCGGGFRTEPGEHLVAHTLRAEGHDASEDGTGRGVPLVPVAYQCHGSNVGPMGTLRSGNSNETGGVPFIFQTRCSRNDRGMPSEVAPALTSCEAGTHADSKPHVGGGGHRVRRLTPRECERLQGFPDDWTRYDAQGSELSDSARYRALGNAVCVNVAQWIGERIVAHG